METPDKNLTAQESLDIITTMINQAKGNVKDNSIYFLLWGWVVVFANITMYTLIRMDYSRPYLAWLIVIPAWIASFYIGFRSGKRQKIVSHLDKITMALWISFGIVTFTTVFFGYKINYQLGPLILLFVSMPTFVSGIILRFRPLLVGGVLFWVFGIISFTLPLAEQNLIGAIAIAFGYLIPGYMLRRKSNT